MSEIKRLNYFTSQFLVAQDFKDEQKYHIEMRRLHNRRMHTWGIVEGLRVFRPKGNDRSVVVLPGVAIDNKGREIVVAAETKVDLSDWGFDLNPPTRQRAFVYAAYKKEGCDPYPGNGLSYNTRWREEAHIGASVEDPAEDPADEPGSRIVLAEVGPAYELNTASRHYSGLNPEADISARRLTVRGETTAAGGLTVEADATVKSNLEVEGRAILRKTLTVDGDATLQTLAVERSINFGAVPRELLTLGEETCAIGIQEFTVYARTIRNFAWYVGGEHSNDLLVAGDKDGDGNRTGTRMMLLADRALKDADGVQISAGLTVEVYATLKKGLTVEDGAATFKKGLTVEDGAATFKKGLTVAGPANLGGDLKLGGFSEAETDEMEKMIWLRKVDFTDPMNQWDEKLIKHKSDKGHFKRAGFGIHMHSIREFGIWSSGPISRDLPESLFSVEGHTGNAFFKGNLTVAGTATTLRQENWYDVNSFFTGWKSFGGSHPAAGYFKDSFGVVHLRGLVVAAAGATKQIFILPLDYRPGFRPVHMVLFENTQFARIDVTTEGIVECEPLKLGWYSLDGITFRAGP